MVDLNTCPPTPPGGERSKIKSFMGRTPGIGILKSKFLTVLGNSNELLNGISNKLTLSISSSESEYCDDDEEVPTFDETIDYTKIDYEFRRIKARRAHEEIISGRFRYPNLLPRPRLEATRSSARDKIRRSASSSSTSSSTSSSYSPPVNRSHVSSTTRSNSIESRHSGGYGRPGRAIPGARRSELDIQRDLSRITDILSVNAAAAAAPNANAGAPHIDVQPPSDRECGNNNGGANEHRLQHPTHLHMDLPAMTQSGTSMVVPPRSRNSNSSTVTSLRDDPDVQISPSIESTDWRNFIRSESQNSVPSWASSISLDCRVGEEPVKEFMKRFIEVIFSNASAIGLELKAEFGALARIDAGRQWFTRFLLEQKSKSKRVDEVTFHSLVQYFAIVLFECGECEDYAPAAVIMNICFMFYNEIEVPGCDTYRQYLFTYMRRQPIWYSQRFWGAAFFEAVQSEREHRLDMRKRRAEKKQRNKAQFAAKSAEEAKLKEQSSVEAATVDEAPTDGAGAGAIVDGEHASTSSSSHRGNIVALKVHAVKKSASQTSAEDTSGGVGGGGGVSAETTALVGGSLSAAAATGKQQQLDPHSIENIVFRQLGAFTCNMHSLGLPQDMCLEFLKKQSATASHNLSKGSAAAGHVFLELQIYKARLTRQSMLDPLK
ncbi:uncharacterized protein LOC118735599 isoform X2 [Rhagoletis pomonella]|uniref:uncharacterized protein LOC118735599 isoform X2 n=1 Tax=Rhagoletis pomonella TaxID=28610 RepID=UPI001787028F|nr:uncharacterized protein LOC118735599 isoform X2 [Rhagoletis pomonella]